MSAGGFFSGKANTYEKMFVKNMPYSKSRILEI